MYDRMDNSNENDFTDDKKDSTSASKFSSIAFELLEMLVQPVFFLAIISSFFLRAVNVDGNSMLNTLHDGDRLTVLKCGYTPVDGDIVIIAPYNSLSDPIIKRVIATEGQSLKIDFSTGTVIVNGKKINEPYIKEKRFCFGNADLPEVIPQGYCFVMGDNRNDSLDSRFQEVGLVPNDKVIGKAFFRFYPFNRLGGIH